MHPGRVDVIGAGALVLRVLMDEFDLDEVVVSEHDILDGIALRLARRDAPEGHGGHHGPPRARQAALAALTPGRCPVSFW